MESKRRHLSRAWSLPVVVAIMFLVVAKLAALQRADVIQELDQRVSHGSTDEATVAVRNLATIPRPPLALLVKAAASPNLDVAREGQQAIGEYLKFCQREVKAERNTKLVSRQLAVLAEALAIERHQFAAADYPWVESTTQKVLRLANRIPSKSTPLVAARCDEILTAIGSSASVASVPSTTAVENLTLLGDGAREALSGKPQVVSDGEDRHLAELAAHPWGAAAVVGIEAGGQVFPITLQASGARATSDEWDVGASAAADVMPDGPSESSWKAQWTHPILRSLPAKPTNAAPSVHDGVDATIITPITPPAKERGEPRSFHAADQPFEGLDSRKLLARWLVAEGADAFPIQQELMERGFGRLTRQLVERLYSEKVEDRMRLVDDVLTDPKIDARPWLLMLADDADGDVRLVAVTIMATSNDPQLIEKAWQAALRDRDPRIAGLAERLRARRGGGSAELNRKRMR